MYGRARTCTTYLCFWYLQVYDECPVAGSTDCDDNSATAAVGCEVVSVAGRVGACYTARLSGPQSTSGTVEHMGDGIFKAEYVGPSAGEYELEVRMGIDIV